MADRADHFHRPSGVSANAIGFDAIASANGRGMVVNNHSMMSNKRPAGFPDPSLFPAAKKPILTSSSGAVIDPDPQLAEVFRAKLSDQVTARNGSKALTTEERKHVLKAFAATTLAEFKMSDLNYFLQHVKRGVEQVKALKKSSDVNNQSQPASAFANINNHAVPNSATTSSGSAAAATAAATTTTTTGGASTNNSYPNVNASVSNTAAAAATGLILADDKGDKPNLSGSFYPLNNLQDAADKEAKDEKVFQRAKAERRAPEEEQQFQDLIHSLGESPVITAEGKLEETRFAEVFSETLRLAKKLKDWFQVWSHCNLKTPEQVVAATVALVQKISAEKDEEELADILAHLVKEKEISPKCMEDSIAKFSAEEGKEIVNGKDVTLLLSHLLVFIYPTQKGDFGWSRVGWGFGQWWPQCKKYIKVLPEPMTALKLVVSKLLEYKADFEPAKQEKVLTRATELVGSRAEACEALGITGDDTVNPSPTPVSNDE